MSAPIRIAVHRCARGTSHGHRRRSATVVAFAIVDADRQDLADHFWTLRGGYAVRYVHRRMVFMHHDVIGREAGRDVSHENANKLDNRRENLCHATRTENLLNVADGPRSHKKTCSIRGVTRDARTLSRPWRGSVRIHGVVHWTRYFGSPEEASSALDALRSQLGVPTSARRPA